MKSKFSLVIAMFVTVFSTVTTAQESSKAATDAAELAKKLSNPISSLISVPFQNNTDYGIGDANGTRNTLNFQPVIPVSISSKLNLITRVVVPIVVQYNISGTGEHEAGLSDAVVSGFMSPKSSSITYGVGPVLLVPIGTDDLLTSKKFGVGPTAVALKQFNGWTVGGLINQIWSVAGDENRSDVNQMFVQPFVSFNWKSGAGIGINAEWTQNWEANTSQVWLNPTVSAVTAMGKQKVQFLFGPRFNVVAATDDTKAVMGWRAGLVFLFPK